MTNDDLTAGDLITLDVHYLYASIGVMLFFDHVARAGIVIPTDSVLFYLRSGECKFDTNTDVEIHYVQYKEHAGFFHDFACKITKL